MKQTIILAIAFICFSNLKAQTGTYGCTFSNPQVITATNKFQVTIGMVAGVPFSIGSTNFRFNYNAAALGLPTVLATAFPSSSFNATTTTGSATTNGIGCINTAYFDAANLNLIPIGATSVPLVTLEFPITNNTLTTDLVFRQITATAIPRTTALDDDKLTTLTQEPALFQDLLGVSLQNTVTPVSVNAGSDVTLTCQTPSTTLTASTTGTISNYLWSNGEITPNITVSPTVTTTYGVTVTGANGTTASDAVVVFPNVNVPIVSISGNTITCAGQGVFLTASTGTSYLWSTGGTSQSIFVAPNTSTNYSVTVTNSSACQGVANQFVMVSQGLTAAISGTDSISLNATTPIVLTASPGNANSYLWSTGATTQSISVLPSATTTYSVTLSDAIGCMSTATKTVYLRSALIGSYGCTFSNPQVIAATNKFRVTLGIVAGNPFSLGSTNFRFNYNATALGVPSVIATAFPSPAFGATTTLGSGSNGIGSINTAYNDAANLNFLPIGATSVPLVTLEFPITNNTLTTDLVFRQITASTPKTTALDDDKSTTLTQVPALFQNLLGVSLQPPILSVNAGADITLTCQNPSATLTATAVGAVSYLWSNGATTATIIVSPSITTTYAVTVTGTSGNTVSDAVVVTPNINAPIVTISGNNTTCFGQSVVLSASNGISYLWSNGATTQTIAVNPSSTTNFSVTVTGTNACNGFGNQLVTVVQNVVTIVSSMDSIPCGNANVTLSATSGNTYLWSTGETTQNIVVNPANIETYMVTATSSNGCIAVASKTIYNLNSTAKGTYGLTFSNPQLVCGNKLRVLVSAVGRPCPSFSLGNSNIGFNFNPLAITSPVVYKSGLPSSSFMSSIVNSANTPAGVGNLVTTYFGAANANSVPIGVTPVPLVTLEFTVVNPNLVSGLSFRQANGSAPNATFVKDDNNKLLVQDPLLIQNLLGINLQGGSPALTVNAGADVTVTCQNQNATLSASASEPAFYIWSNGQNTQNAAVSPKVITTYYVTATTANGCTAVDNITVFTEDGSYGLMFMNPEVKCNNKFRVTLGARACIPFSLGSNNIRFNFNPLAITNPVVISSYFSNAAFSATSTTGTDNNLGIASINTAYNYIPNASLLPIDGPTPLVLVEFTILDSTLNTDLVFRRNNAPTLPSILLDDDNVTTLFQISTLFQDLFGHSLLPNATTLSVNAGADVTLDCKNTATTLFAYSSAAITYSWSNGANTPNINVNPTTTTTYTVTVTDCNNNTQSDEVTVFVDNNLPNVTITGDTLICFNQSTTLNVSSGASYLWSTGATSQSITATPNANTNYSVTVTASNGCKAFASHLVAVSPALNVHISGQNIIPCQGTNTVLTASGGTSYIWSTGATTPSITVAPISATTYIVTATNNNGCKGISSKTVVIQNSNIGTYGMVFTNPQVNACTNKFRVTIGVVACSPFSLGSNNIRFNYNPLAINAPVIVGTAFPSPQFLPPTNNGTNVNLGIMGINTSYFGAKNANLIQVGATPVSLITVEFTIINPSLTTNLVFRSSNALNPKTILLDDDKATTLIAVPSLFQDLQNVSLLSPITLSAVPPNLTLNCNDPIPAPANVTAQSPCTTVTMSETTTKGNNASSCDFYNYIITRTWTATNTQNITNTAQQTIQVQDITAPTAICKNISLIIANNASSATLNATNINNGSFDNCSPVTFGICQGSGCVSSSSTITLSQSLIPAGETQVDIPVTLTVSDVCGNTSTCTAIVTLIKASTLTSNGTNLKLITQNAIDDSNLTENQPTNKNIRAHGEMNCFPNPFIEELNIQYNLIENVSSVTLKIYDNQGRLLHLKDKAAQNAGFHKVLWNLSDLPSGLYHICLEINGKCTKTTRVVLLK